MPKANKNVKSQASPTVTEWRVYERDNIGSQCVWKRVPPCKYLLTFKTYGWGLDWIKSKGEKDKVYYIGRFSATAKPNTNAITSQFQPSTVPEKWAFNETYLWHKAGSDATFSSAHRIPLESRAQRSMNHWVCGMCLMGLKCDASQNHGRCLPQNEAIEMKIKQMKIIE